MQRRTDNFKIPTGRPSDASRHGLGTAPYFAWGPEVARTGLRRNAVYLVRPDGYVALADPDASPNALSSYLTAREISSLQ